VNSTVASILLAVTLFAVPLHRTGEVALPSPPPLPAKSVPCSSIAPTPQTRKTYFNADVFAFSSRNVRVHGTFSGFLPNGGVEEPSQVWLYVRLDDGLPQYISIYPSGDRKLTQYSLGFLNVAEGSHVIDVGLASHVVSRSAYARICFNVAKGKSTWYQF